ncbi:MAG: hypothetical protein WCP97_05610 [bacterium]
MTCTLALIHGFAAGVEFSYLRPRLTAETCFPAFEPLLKTGKAEIFQWGITEDLSLHQTLNIKEIQRIYRTEKAMAGSNAVQEKLEKFLHRNQPSAILCHSMGAYLLLEYMNAKGLPAFVKTIIFVQADLPRRFHLRDVACKSRLQKGSLQMYNYFCPWDQALWTSVFQNKNSSAGLQGALVPQVENCFFPLYTSLNLHMSSVSNPVFRKEILKLCCDK